MIRVPITEVHEIELSSRCNLACVYCPHPMLEREKADMSWDTFERTLEHVEYYCDRGTQREVSLTGIGEAVLHPEFERMLMMTREAVGARPIIMATNGVAMTEALAGLLAQEEVTVYVSLHRPEMAGPAVEMLRRTGAKVHYNKAFVDSALDWAGQVEWFRSAPPSTCQYLARGWAVVRQCGAVDACCMDAHSLHPIGNVADAPGSLETHVIPLCASCQLKVPDALREAA